MPPIIDSDVDEDSGLAGLRGREAQLTEKLQKEWVQKDAKVKARTERLLAEVRAAITKATTAAPVAPAAAVAVNQEGK